MPAEAEFHESEHLFFYSTETNRVSAGELADSLIGLEGVVGSIGPILERMLEIRIAEVEVLITEVAIGSYRENFIVRMLFGKGATLERNIEKLRKKAGLANMEPKKLIGLVILVALAYAVYLHTKPGDPMTGIIVNSFNNIGGTNLSGEQIVEIAKAALNHKETEQLKRDAVKLLRPNGGQVSGFVQIDNDPHLTLPKEAIDVVPTKYEREADVPTNQDFDHVYLSVRSADLDRPSAGWTAIAPDHAEKRLPLRIMPEVSIHDVPIGRTFPADITIIYQTKAGKPREPKEYLLRKVHKPERPKPQVADGNLELGI